MACAICCMHSCAHKNVFVFPKIDSCISHVISINSIIYRKHINEQVTSWYYFELLDRAFKHDDVIKWKHFPRYWPFVRGIHRSPVNSRHKGQWRRALMFSLIRVSINGWVKSGGAGDLRRHRAIMTSQLWAKWGFFALEKRAWSWTSLIRNDLQESMLSRGGVSGVN